MWDEAAQSGPKPSTAGSVVKDALPVATLRQTISNLEAEVGGLGGQLAALEASLTPVLAPEPPEESVGRNLIVGAGSPVTTRLARSVVEVARFRDRVQRLIDLADVALGDEEF